MRAPPSLFPRQAQPSFELGLTDDYNGTQDAFKDWTLHAHAVSSVDLPAARATIEFDDLRAVFDGRSVCFRAPGAMELPIARSSPRRKYPSPSSPTSSGLDSWRWVKYDPWGANRFAPACEGSPCPSLPSGGGAPSLRPFTIPSSSSRWFPRYPIPPSSAAVAFRVTHTGWSSTTSPGSTSFPCWAWAVTMLCAPPCLSGGTMRSMSCFVWSASPWVPRSLVDSELK